MDTIVKYLLATKMREWLSRHYAIFCHVVLGALLIPLLVIVVWSIRQFQKVDRYTSQVEHLYFLAGCNEDVLARKQALLEHFERSDPEYIPTQIEGMTFMQSEILDLKAVLSAPALKENALWQERLQFLEQGNRLSFVEQVLGDGAFYVESQWVQQSPIEMSDDELKQLLTKIEGAEIAYHRPSSGRPDLFIKRYGLQKVAAGVWRLVNLEFVKRESKVS